MDTYYKFHRVEGVQIGLRLYSYYLHDQHILDLLLENGEVVSVRAHDCRLRVIIEPKPEHVLLFKTLTETTHA